MSETQIHISAIICFFDILPMKNMTSTYTKASATVEIISQTAWYITDENHKKVRSQHTKVITDVNGEFLTANPNLRGQLLKQKVIL